VISSGLFIVLEGVDCCGKSTQSRALAEWMGAEWRCFPDRTTPIGKLIDGHLKDNWSAARNTPRSDQFPGKSEEDLSLNALMFQALQVANRVEVMPALMATLGTGTSVVCDRYWGSGYAYGGADGLAKNYLVKLHQFFPEPDLNILLDVSHTTVESRMKGRPGKTERYETQPDLLKTVIQNYRELWQAYQHDSRWITLDGGGSLVEVQDGLRAAVLNLQEYRRQWEHA
jgi:dTMP kinase